MNGHKKNSRRNFLKAGIALNSASLIPANLISIENLFGRFANSIREGYTILFQGDSITDGNRTRNDDWNHLMGHGYVYIISSKLWYEFPDKKFKIYNRGISGNKITDLAQRWNEDTIALKPDLLSILIGINDISAFLNGDKNFTPDQYEREFRNLLIKTKTEFPTIQFVLCEPFILPVAPVNNKLEMYNTEIKKRQEVVSRLATEFDAIYIPFQNLFNEALKKAPADYWIWDGIHPMPAGHEMMALEWMKIVGKKLSLDII